MALSWRFSAVTDIGRTRKKNDDSGYAGPYLVMVADGMGGAPAGDLASAVAVETMMRLDAPPSDDLLQALAGALHRANDRLAELIENDSSVAGMGTTVTAALLDGERIGVAHLGDSRGYLWRSGELRRITHDHTWVQSLIDEGRISEDEAKVHSHRSLLLKVLDGRDDHDPDLTLYDVKAGDRVLLCSDGLSGFVEDERIERVLSIGTADSTANELMQLALEGGSTDNITVVVADVVDEPAPTLDPIVVGAVVGKPRRPGSRLRTRAQGEHPPSGKSLMLDPTGDPEELRYAPRAPRRFLGLRRFALTLVIVGVLVGAAVVAYGWSQQQYYVSSDDGRVAIFQGVQGDIPGIELHHVYEEQDLLLSELPSFRRSQVVEGLTADNLDHAEVIVDNLVEFARTCAQQPSDPDMTTTQGTATLAATPSSRTTAATPPDAPLTSAPRKAPVTTTPRDTEKPNRAVPTTTAEAVTTEPTRGAAASQECAGASPSTGTPR
jgi:protein phosphatase